MEKEDCGGNCSILLSREKSHVWKLSNDSARERIKQKSFKDPGNTTSLRPREEDTVHILIVRPKQEGGKNTESPDKELEVSFLYSAF